MMSQFERFGKYILLEKLASGGMAEIYLAKSLGAQGINKFLAVKRILPQFCENPEFKEMFREEAKVSVNLRHSNVVPIFDFGEERNQFYLVMDYVEGRNLRQILNELKKQQIQFSVEQICYMIREAAAGLDHAHRCIDGSTGRPLNIIHRDISPQNIMVSFEGEVKIIDFGIAKAETQMEATKAGTLKGKFGYMSPEQADGHNIDVRTDIFSLGIVLWELLANDRLFTASSEAAILRKIRDCQIPAIRKINPNTPPELEKIVNKVLAKDPALRYQTAAALHKDLNRFLNTYYPEFNAQDFAVFVKNAFASAYQETKRKLVEYAKTQNFEERIGDPTPAGQTPRPPGRGEATVIDRSVPEADEEELLKLDTHHSIKVDLKELKRDQSQAGTKGMAPRGTNVGVTPGHGMPSVPGMHTKPSIPIAGATGIHKMPLRSPPPSVGVDDALGWIIRFGVVAVFAVGGIWAWKNKIIDLHGLTGGRAPAKAAAPVEGTIEPASKAAFKVTISSDPMGARILVDCQDTANFTPFMQEFEGNKSVHVSLKRDGYYPYDIDLVPVKNAQTLSAVMQPLSHTGFLSVHVSNGGTHPIVEINGKRICERDAELYPIPAGVPVQVRARNSFTGAMAEQTITAEADQKKTIELILLGTP